MVVEGMKFRKGGNGEVEIGNIKIDKKGEI